MLKSILISAFTFCTVGATAQAATIQNMDMSQNQWAVLEFQNTNSLNLAITPGKTDGSFSYTYAFSENGCGKDASQYNTWSCMPESFGTNVINTGYAFNFGEGWFDKTSAGNVRETVSVNYVKEGAENIFMYFRVTSGSGSLSRVLDVVDSPAPDVVDPPAPVPLPAAGLMLLAGIAGIGSLRLRKRQHTNAI